MCNKAFIFTIVNQVNRKIFKEQLKALNANLVKNARKDHDCLTQQCRKVFQSVSDSFTAHCCEEFSQIYDVKHIPVKLVNGSRNNLKPTLNKIRAKKFKSLVNKFSRQATPEQIKKTTSACSSRILQRIYDK